MGWGGHSNRPPPLLSRWIYTLTEAVWQAGSRTFGASLYTDFALCSESDFALRVFPAMGGLCFSSIPRVDRFATQIIRSPHLKKFVAYFGPWCYGTRIKAEDVGMWTRTDNELREVYDRWAKHATGTTEVILDVPRVKRSA